MAEKGHFQQHRIYNASEILTVPNGTNLSNSIELAGTFIIGFITPSALSSNKLSFQASIDNTNWFDIYDASGVSKKEIAIGANRAISLSEELHNKDFPFIRIQTANNEGAERKFQLILSPR